MNSGDVKRGTDENVVHRITQVLTRTLVEVLQFHQDVPKELKGIKNYK
jgi:hypothetical protein